MSHAYDRILNSLKEALAIVEGTADPETYVVHYPPDEPLALEAAVPQCPPVEADVS